jgi:FixJ family two-component response regulator
MPGMDGLTLSLHVKGMSLNTPVVLLLDENIVNVMSRIKVGRIDFIDANITHRKFLNFEILQTVILKFFNIWQLKPTYLKSIGLW